MTAAAIIVGVALGMILAAAMVYAGLVIGFVVPTSTIAAILGFGLLRGVLRRGSVVETNICQTVASGINNAAAGVIFTFPALLLMGEVSWSLPAIAAAAVAGAFLGTLFIIPLRKQMIELERLQFPWGVATAEVLRSPGAGARKSAILGAAAIAAFAFGSLVSFGVLPRMLDVGQLLGLPVWIPAAFALSLLSVGAGYLTGRSGLVVLAGGVLACWAIGPAVVGLGWLPAAPDGVDGEVFIAETLAREINRPLGIGFLMGGAFAGVAWALPMLVAALKGLRRQRIRTMSGHDSAKPEELSLGIVLCGVGVSLVALCAATYLTEPEVGFGRALLTGVVGTLWMALAGIIVAQCSGMTGWSPVSGLALLSVPLVLLITGG